jgi:outer membrane protein assembly factor BamE (lipoprotein component of BamABCDE complex)
MNTLGLSMKIYFNILLLLITVLFSGISYSDVLIIDRIKQAQSFATPERGMTKNQVINQFGEPLLKKDPVGEPPITVWNYQKFTVYFERRWVINSVVNKANTDEKGPKYVE